ncbi:MAG TPA: nitroreductase/quinone reductase family protein [Acidimicrobiales bacterium]|nr:nitroreductase/quinone reductase family protein [Acidimicrobiales bacterium]
MIVYLDSSVLARAYLADEPGHEQATSLLADPEIRLITGTWTRIEVSGALRRAARAGRGDGAGLLELLDGDLGTAGPVTVVAADQKEVEERALGLVREHAIGAMDAWHLAVAALVLPSLVEPGKDAGFATLHEAQSSVATTLGLRLVKVGCPGHRDGGRRGKNGGDAVRRYERWARSRPAGRNGAGGNGTGRNGAGRPAGKSRSDVTDFNQAIIEEFRANGGQVGGGFAGAPLLLLHTTGARSGLDRVSPMMYQDLGGPVAVFASKAGAPSDPDWYRNLVANPAVTAEIGTDTRGFTARTATGEERDRIWTLQKEDYPAFAEYESKTDRVIPVVVLDPA